MCNGCGWGYNRIPLVDPITAQKGVILHEGPGINIVDNSDAHNYDFIISREEIIQLTVILTLIAKVAGVAKTIPILKGTTIDRVELSWVYNKAIASQTLTNSGGMTVPTLTPDLLLYTYTGQTITSDKTITITGNDGLGFPESVGTDSKSITFGNEIILGKGASRIGSSASTLEAFIDSLPTHVIKTSRVYTFNTVGVADEKDFVAIPASFGLATFTKGIFTGGFIRLKNVVGVLKSELLDGDVETPIVFTNPAGFSEAYYIYETLFDNQVDGVTPFIIS